MSAAMLTHAHHWLMRIFAGTLVLSSPTVAQAAGETEFWRSVRDSHNPAELRSHIDDYPIGRFATLARLRLEELSRKLVAENQSCSNGSSGCSTITADDVLVRKDEFTGQILNVSGFVLPGTVDKFFLCSPGSSECLQVASTKLGPNDRVRLLHCSLSQKSCPVRVTGLFFLDYLWANTIVWESKP